MGSLSGEGDCSWRLSLINEDNPMRPLAIQTPLIESQYLKNKLNKHVYFKLECLQPSGSFKLRGIGALCQEELQRGAKALVIPPKNK